MEIQLVKWSNDYLWDNKYFSVPDYKVKEAIAKNQPIQAVWINATDPSKDTKILSVEKLKIPDDVSPSQVNTKSVGAPTYCYYYFLWNDKSDLKFQSGQPLKAVLVSKETSVSKNFEKDKAQEEVNFTPEPPIKESLEDFLSSPEAVVKRQGAKFVVIVPREFTLTEYVGYKVKNFREAAGLSMEQLAKKTKDSELDSRRTSGVRGITATAISLIENPNFDSNPSLHSLQSICEALDLHITDLFPPK